SVKPGQRARLSSVRRRPGVRSARPGQRRSDLYRRPKEQAMSRIHITLVLAALALCAWAAFLTPAVADPVINRFEGGGLLAIDADGDAVVHLFGNASLLGKFTGYGEVAFEVADQDGDVEGEGVFALTAANGDVLVAVVTWDIDAKGNGQLAFHWRDAVTFSDGTTAASTVRFAGRRPPGITAT